VVVTSASMKGKVKGKATPVQAYGRTRWFQQIEVPRILDNRYMKVIRLSALRNGRLYASGNIQGTHFC
jgi:hypothetical protein